MEVEEMAETMTAEEIARAWDAEAGIDRDETQFPLDEPLRDAANRWNQGTDVEYIAALEAGDVSAILAGRAVWGLAPFC